MTNKPLLLVVCLAVLAAVVPERVTAQSDLDAFMERVLARRDDNWKKLQQYVLEEKESFDITGPGGLPLYGLRKEYTWFIKQGVFVRSPVKANGVTISEADRRKAETDWLRRQTNRQERRKRRAEREAKGEPPEKENQAVAITPTTIKVLDGSESTTGPEAPSNVEDVLRQGMEPEFVSSAYFLKFRFESGHYALAGREKIDGHDTLKIEYYPRTGLFKDGKSKPAKKARDKDDELEEKMNKVSLVTLWVDPATHQILQYIFDDLDMDFFPGRALVRIDDLQATMKMAQAFPNVWLPASIGMKFGMMLAVGAVDAAYQVEYLNYKLADVSSRIVK